MTTPLSAEFLALQEVLAGRYSIERELGRGGMGIVLLARDVALDRPVAIKLLPPHLATQRHARDRFLQEARTAAGLSHPNIVPIHLVEAHGELVFFVMGYVDGETLRERVERTGRLQPRLAMKLLQEAAWALTYAHQRGVIHRDVKPDNIMIERATERTLVTDFGIALGQGDAGTASDVVVGTARYMSPEQACGEPVDARSDLYSLGATFFYGLTGRAPFEASNLPAILAKQVSEPAPLLHGIRPELPAKLAAVIDRCLRKMPAERFQTGDDVARVVGEARGRDFRAPPLVRAFVRNAHVSTMVFLALATATQTVTVGGASGVRLTMGGPGVIGAILLFQLVVVARRLLKDGYAFGDIRAALLAEAQVQAEEAEVIKQRRWFRRLDTLWFRLWAGRVGRLFFRLAGIGLKTPARVALASVDRTEQVLGRSAHAAYAALPDATRHQASAVPQVLDRLEAGAEALRAQGDTGERLTETVAALERLRLALFRLQTGEGSLGDLTLALERAKAIGEHVDRQLAAAREVRAQLE
ncbi:MAG TPA: serine/threonine-protein kinase [Gemmatimonadales bacterium]|nr:serine/threonine-protein kinase [Gemmatimonadales bacterium]